MALHDMRSRTWALAHRSRGARAMTRDRAKRLFHALLVSATGAAATVACGGSVTAIGNSEEQNPEAGDPGDRQADARPPTVRHDAEPQSPDAAVDAPADTRSDVVVTQGCVTLSSRSTAGLQEG